MMMRTITGAMLALVLATSATLACKGEEELFSDDFSDPEISKDQWPSSDHITIEKGFLQIKMKPRYLGQAPIPTGAKEFDICADITYPQAQKPDGGTFGGFIFWWKDWENFYYVVTTPIGLVGAARVTKGRELVLAQGKVYSALKPGAGSTNTLRLSLKGNTATVYGNDKRLVGFRAVTADANDHVALAAQSEEAQENAWKFSNVKMTAP